MHEFWTIPTINMMHSRSQKYTNVVVGDYEIQTFKVVVIMFLSFDVSIPTSAHPLFFWTKWFGQIYINVSFL